MVINGDRQAVHYFESNSPSVALLYGENTYMIEKLSALIKKKNSADFPEFNSYTVDGRFQINFEELANAALSLPFMSERKFVLIDDLDYSQQTGDFQKNVEELIEQRSDSTCLLITLKTNFPDPKKKSAKETRLASLCDKYGAVCPLPLPSQTDVARQIANKAVKAGVKITSSVAVTLAEYCGNDMLRALNETDKLISYRKDGEITADDVNLLVEPVIEARVFDIAARLTAKDLDKALSVIKELIANRENPVTILTILSMSFCDFYRAAIAKKSGIPEQTAAKELGYLGGSAYRFKKASEIQAKIPIQALGKIVKLLARADLSMKEAGVNQQALLEFTTAQIYIIICGGEEQII